MKKLILGGIFICLALPINCPAQVSVKAKVGVSYIEHLTLGGTLQLADKHNLSLLYGSNIFIRTGDFSSVLLQYDRLLLNQKIAGITPVLGLKTGYAVFSNEYYKWKLLTLIPFAGASLPINKKLDVIAEIGCTGSFELSVKRISYGEIGNYKTFLPEFKAGISYLIFQK